LNGLIIEWVNQQYIQASDASRIKVLLLEHWEKSEVDGPDLVSAIELYKERANTIVDLAKYLQVFYSDEFEYAEKAVKKNWKDNSAAILTSVKQKLVALDNWAQEGLSEVVKNTVAEFEVGFAKVAQPLRIALLGDTNSPSIDLILELVGREFALKRIDKALEHFK